MSWQLQEAKQRFSQLIRCALDEGPQIVTRHGDEVIVVLSSDEYRRLTSNVPNFKDFLLSMPDPDDLELRRADEVARTVEL